jgi:predicted deacylase
VCKCLRGNTVSVLVAVGAKPGKRVALTSGVHGDEISPVHMIQTVMSQFDPAQMSGTVLAVPDVSRPALEGMARRWPNGERKSSRDKTLFVTRKPLPLPCQAIQILRF